MVLGWKRVQYFKEFIYNVELKGYFYEVIWAFLNIPGSLKRFSVGVKRCQMLVDSRFQHKKNFGAGLLLERSNHGSTCFK